MDQTEATFKPSDEKTISLWMEIKEKATPIQNELFQVKKCIKLKSKSTQER